MINQIRNFYSDYFSRNGLNPLLGEIFGILLTREAPISLSNVAKELNLSKAAISVQIRILLRMGYCRKLPRSSDRMDYYVVNESHIEAVLANNIRIKKFQLEELSRICKSSPESLSPLILDRLSRIKQFRELECQMEENLLDEARQLFLKK
ncbi:MAG: hypothetical protein JXR63_07225 [Spirochaetales bacterium]|nr:hypothetical protein [Spirochaetales bacterium]